MQVASNVFEAARQLGTGFRGLMAKYLTEKYPVRWKSLIMREESEMKRLVGLVVGAVLAAVALGVR